MLTVAWNPSGFHVLKALLKWGEFNANSKGNDILVANSDWRRLATGTRSNKLRVHADDADFTASAERPFACGGILKDLRKSNASLLVER
jgi:hypothetical protein